MSILPEITLPSILLILLAVAGPPAGGGSAPPGPTLPAPATAPAATTGVVRAAANVSTTVPVTIQSSAPQALLRLQDTLAWKTRAAPVLVIPAQTMTPETYERIVEDLSVMARIIEKNIHTASEDGLGFPVLGDLMYGQNTSWRVGGAGPTVLQAPGGKPRALFLGGYGAVFSLHVAFPLVPPPQTPEPNETTQRDATWAQVRQELLDPQAARRTQKGAPPERTYGAAVVEDLRTTLMGLLQHAANIRDLEPESWLTILVQGPSPAAQDRAPEPLASQWAGPLATPATGRSLLTLRVRKVDIDQLAQGRLDATQFQQRVQVTTH
ncbi:MAG: hypothetical protein FJ280_01515 [Planctomycetes bacterium]|nr:hypothetical protein [Planctomycetota bacterium]